MDKTTVPQIGKERKLKKSGRTSGLTNKQIRLNPDLHRRNKLQWLADLELSRLRKIAAREYKDFVTSYQKRWKGVLKTKWRSADKRRRKLIRNSKIRGDRTLTRQLFVIKFGPCKCFWCEKFLPDGGTIDHILALSKGGKHSSDNVCAACTDCNSEKSDGHHQDTAKIPALL